jgi:hypothetical protein
VFQVAHKAASETRVFVYSAEILFISANGSCAWTSEELEARVQIVFTPIGRL